MQILTSTRISNSWFDNSLANKDTNCDFFSEWCTKDKTPYSFKCIWCSTKDLLLSTKKIKSLVQHSESSKHIKKRESFKKKSQQHLTPSSSNSEQNKIQSSKYNIGLFTSEMDRTVCCLMKVKTLHTTNTSK
jgi:hypothetical protein